MQRQRASTVTEPKIDRRVFLKTAAHSAVAISALPTVLSLRDRAYAAPR